MLIVIDNGNIDSLNEEKYENVIKLVWKAGPLRRNILEKFPNLIEFICYYNNLTTLNHMPNFLNLQQFDCSYNNLTTLDGMPNLPNLQKFYCSDNSLKTLEQMPNFLNLQVFDCHNNNLTTLNQMPNLTNLQNFYCDNNNLTTLDQMPNFPNLQVFYCPDNNLTTLEHIPNLPNLQNFFCSYNKLTTLKQMPNFPNLLEFSCYGNKITTLSGMPNFPNLQEFNCKGNKITTLNGMPDLPNLRIFDCSNNNIEDFERIILFTRLKYIYYHGNPYNEFSLRLQRFIDRIRNKNVNHSIYNDSQNVHDTNIQRTVRESVFNLLKDPKPQFFDINEILNLDIDVKAKQILSKFYECNDQHSTLFMKYSELLPYIWNRIKNHKDRDTLIKIFEQNILDNEDRCFTGMFNKTVNTLVGFYDDIKVEISTGSHIQALIQVTREKGQFNRESIEQILKEAGYADEEIEPWLEAIDEELKIEN